MGGCRVVEGCKMVFRRVVEVLEMSARLLRSVLGSKRGLGTDF